MPEAVGFRHLLHLRTGISDGDEAAAIAPGALEEVLLEDIRLERAARFAGNDKQRLLQIDAGLKRNTTTALANIDRATATLDQAGTLRDKLANSVDVTELNEWLRRNRNYDVALRRLYVASAASPNRVTPELRAASNAEKAARAELPGDTSGLVIIMAEIGRGGLNQAVLAIEEARGSLADVLDAEAAANASASPSPGP